MTMLNVLGWMMIASLSTAAIWASVWLNGWKVGLGTVIGVLAVGGWVMLAVELMYK